MEVGMALTYSKYLEIDELLSLQKPRSDGPEHDEMLFIIIHQVYELWFKQVIHEVDWLQGHLEAGNTPPVLHAFKRILTILKVLVAQIDILETMTPLDFLSFRDRLETGSGFQSYQFRSLEFLLGVKSPDAVKRFKKGSPGHEDLSRRWSEPSLWDSFLVFLLKQGYRVPADQMNRDNTEPIKPSPKLQKLLVKVYRSEEDFLTAHVCERLVDFDEGMQEWRYRHFKMVERTIGSKRGTGGSAGAPYLKTTLFKPLFPDLWKIRTDF
jgi:tryptophan 2,3-dioxygenase